jgi:hypothetical protein
MWHWRGHRYTHRNFVEAPEGRPLGRTESRWKNSIEIVLKEIGW